jgi:hypothetical protein
MLETSMLSNLFYKHFVNLEILAELLSKCWNEKRGKSNTTIKTDL